MWWYILYTHPCFISTSARMPMFVSAALVVCVCVCVCVCVSLKADYADLDFSVSHWGRENYRKLLALKKRSWVIRVNEWYIDIVLCTYSLSMIARCSGFTAFIHVCPYWCMCVQIWPRRSVLWPPRGWKRALGRERQLQNRLARPLLNDRFFLCVFNLVIFTVCMGHFYSSIF